MAVLTEVPGLKVTIRVAGQDLTEYKDDDEEEPKPLTQSVFVQAESGVKFLIQPKFDSREFPHPKNHVMLKVYLDGVSICYQCYSPADIDARSCPGLDCVRELIDDRYVIRDFSFAALDIVEGNADMNLKGKLDSLGTVSVRFYRVKCEDVPNRPTAEQTTTPRPVQPTAPLASGLLQTGQVPEKNLKGSAVSHQALLLFSHTIPYNPAAEQRRPKQKKTFIDQTPFATFNFKYRSRASLRALRIIEETPLPVPLEDRPLESLTPEELRQLVTRQKEQLTQKSEEIKIKKEKRDRSSEESDADDELDVAETKYASPKKKKQRETDSVIHISDED